MPRKILTRTSHLRDAILKITHFKSMLKLQKISGFLNDDWIKSSYKNLECIENVNFVLGWIFVIPSHLRENRTFL